MLECNEQLYWQAVKVFINTWHGYMSPTQSDLHKFVWSFRQILYENVALNSDTLCWCHFVTKQITSESRYWTNEERQRFEKALKTWVWHTLDLSFFLLECFYSCVWHTEMPIIQRCESSLSNIWIMQGLALIAQVIWCETSNMDYCYAWQSQDFGSPSYVQHDNTKKIA